MKIWDRKKLLFIAMQMQNPLLANQIMRDVAFDPTAMNGFECLRLWAKYGAQSVQMPDTYMAALMATDASAAIDEDTKLPWPAFEIMTPPGMLPTEDGDVVSLIVTRFADAQAGPHPYRVAYYSNQLQAIQTFATIAEMVAPKRARLNLNDRVIPPESREWLSQEDRAQSLDIEVDEEQETRIWRCVGRLIGGVILAIENARAERPKAYPRGDMKVKHRREGPELQANVWKLGAPLKLDLRPQMREYLTGHGKGGGVPSVRTLVRGHWKKQVHGPGRKLRKNISIDPYFRGEGPTLIRTTKLDPNDPDLEGLL